MIHLTGGWTLGCGNRVTALRYPPRSIPAVGRRRARAPKRLFRKGETGAKESGGDGAILELLIRRGRRS